MLRIGRLQQTQNLAHPWLNETREPVNLLSGHKPIECKWVFKVKHNNDVKVELYEYGKPSTKPYN